MNDYFFPAQDALFLLNEVLGIENHCQRIERGDINSELVTAIIDEAAKLGTELLGPLNRKGDQEGAKYQGNQVFSTTGFKEAYQTYSENGWMSLTGDEQFGGQGLPIALGRVTDEIWQTANLSFALCPLLSQGAIEAIKSHGSDKLKETYLPPMLEGRWTGTMNLTEPQAGSDLAMLRSTATPCDAHYLIKGQKIFITWGEHDMAENIIHLVLARLPNAPTGVKGISLFLVPKYLVNDDGSLGQRNDVLCTSIEHKLGIHGSPTCSLSFGENEGAVGYLLGEPNKGLACMFTMMNHARQGVGLQGLAITERSYQHALAYAKDRKQGRSSSEPLVDIVHHPDVKRMLMLMKTGTLAMRYLAYRSAFDMDIAHCSSSMNEHVSSARVALLTPIVKGWMTELSIELTSLGIQVCGGMGFVEETGIAQYYRDARILPIYEGTTGIQGQDLVFRKVLFDNGEALTNLLDEISSDIVSFKENDKYLRQMKYQLRKALNEAQEVLGFIKTSSDIDALNAASTNIMMMLGYLLGGWGMAKEANTAFELIGKDKYPNNFLESKLVCCGFYASHYMPRVNALQQSIMQGFDAVNEMTVSSL
jgi:alkylation response protein AidB-like acyl-CoA dehydrogenase